MRRSLLGGFAILAVGCVTVTGQVTDRAAHDFRCPRNRIRVKKIQGSGTAGTYKASGCQRERLYTVICGQTGCIVDAESEMVGGGPVPLPAPEPESREPVEAPTGAAGFVFGMSAADAEATCTQAGHEYEQSGDGAACSGTAANVGFDSRVRLSFCSDALCRVRMAEKLEGKLQAVTKRYSSVMSLLEDRYGKPSSHKGNVPKECADVARCLSNEELFLRTRWTFPNEQRVTIELVEDDGVALELDYDAPAGAGDLAL